MSHIISEEPISKQCDDIVKVGVVERKARLKLDQSKTGNPVVDHFKTHYWVGAEFTGRYQFLKLGTVIVKELPKKMK